MDGYLLIEPFEVTITEDGYTHFFLLEDKGYVPLEEPLIFSVTEENADALIRLEIPNRLARQDIQLIKRDRLNEQPLENVPFHLYNIATDENGELTETLIEKYLTDKEGKINFSIRSTIPKYKQVTYLFGEKKVIRRAILGIQDSF